MSKTNPYTQAMLERAIRAAERTGHVVLGIRPDGTVLTEKVDSQRSVLTDPDKPRDAREKLGVR